MLFSDVASTARQPSKVSLFSDVASTTQQPSESRSSRMSPPPATVQGLALLGRCLHPQQPSKVSLFSDVASPHSNRPRSRSSQTSPPPHSNRPRSRSSRMLPPPPNRPRSRSSRMLPRPPNSCPRSRSSRMLPRPPATVRVSLFSDASTTQQPSRFRSSQMLPPATTVQGFAFLRFESVKNNSNIVSEVSSTLPQRSENNDSMLESMNTMMKRKFNENAYFKM